MSARDSLIGAAYCGFDPKRFDPLKAAVAAVDAYRAEVLREAAAEIRAAGCQEVNWCGCPVAADLIDPDTP